MADGDQIIANAADGTQHIFPSGTDVSVIDAAMKRYVARPEAQPGAFQQRPGGPVLNAKNLGASTDEGAGIGSVLRGTALGAASGLGIPETTTPIKDLGSNLSEQIKTWFRPLWNPSSTTVGESIKTNPAVTVPSGLATGFGNAVDAVNPVVDNFFRMLTGKQSVPIDSEKAAHDITSFATQVGAAKAGTKTPEALTDPLGREAMQNVMNQGPSKAAFISRQVERANATQSAVKSTLDAVHEDGKQLMSGVSQHVDSAEPNGAFNRADVHAAVKDAMGVVKADQKVPAAITKVLDTFKPDDTGGWMQKGGKAAKGPTVGGKTLDLSNPSDKAAFEKYKNAGVFTPEEAARYEGGGSPEGKMSFEELKQIHSDIGKQIANTEGAVEAGVKAAYSKLGEMLRNKAESHGMLNEWSEGASKVKTFYDTAYRSPLKDTYFGGNHGKIMKPLVSDDLGPTVWKQLEKVAPYGLDMDKLKQTVDGYRYGKKMDMLNEPSRMTPILAAISPKMAALRIAIPRGMRTAGMTEHLYGKGLENVPEVPTSKIYPSAKAAAKAAQTAREQGYPATQSKINRGNRPATLAGWETEDEAARRGASGVNPATKSARRHYEKNR